MIRWAMTRYLSSANWNQCHHFCSPLPLETNSPFSKSMHGMSACLLTRQPCSSIIWRILFLRVFMMIFSSHSIEIILYIRLVIYSLWVFVCACVHVHMFAYTHAWLCIQTSRRKCLSREISDMCIFFLSVLWSIMFWLNPLRYALFSSSQWAFNLSKSKDLKIIPHTHT